MKWAYGITTVPDRLYSYLPKTVDSLRNAGFTTPTLFIDGAPIKVRYDLPLVFRGDKIGAFGNWILSLLELWIRYPNYDRYALFQDDFETYKNLKQYLESCKLQDDQYWNLLTFPQNEGLRPDNNYIGWYYSNQRGRGAVALVFNHTCLHKILSSEQVMAKPQVGRNPHRNIDGCLVEAANAIGIREIVHYPTLVHHIGDCSALGNYQHKKPNTFLGQEHDALTFLKPTP